MLKWSLCCFCAPLLDFGAKPASKLPGVEFIEVRDALQPRRFAATTAASEVGRQVVDAEAAAFMQCLRPPANRENVYSCVARLPVGLCGFALLRRCGEVLVLG